MTKQLTSRIGWVDTAKGIGLLCVILGHLGIPYLGTWIYFFHMPLFFFLSGVVFSGGKYDFKTFLTKKLRSLVVPYFTLGGGIFLFFSIVYALEGRPAGDYLDMLRSFLIQEHYWTVWFLACLFLTELLYYGIHRLCGENPPLCWIASGSICLFGLIRYRLGWGSLPWNLDVALVAQFFFHTGFRFKPHAQKLASFDSWGLMKRLVIAGSLMVLNLGLGFVGIRVGGGFLDMSMGLYGSEVFTFLSAYCGIAGVILLARCIDWRWLSWMGCNTMVLFGWHSRIVIVACQYLYADLGVFQGADLVSKLSYAVCTFSIILIMLVPATHMIKRSRFHSCFGL